MTAPTYGEHITLADDARLTPVEPATILLHKPAGYTCSMKDKGRLIYDLLPPRFRERDPALSPVGRLDRDTTGLLLMTSHDREFMNRIVNKIVEIDGGSLTSYSGDYEFYEQQRAQAVGGGFQVPIAALARRRAGACAATIARQAVEGGGRDKCRNCMAMPGPTPSRSSSTTITPRLTE